MATLSHSVLFVCYGNICRSTIAEAVFRDLVTKRGVANEWLIDSAGTGDHERGSPLYHTAQKVLKNHGIKSDHRARQIRKEDFDKFQYILGFDNYNIREINSVKPKSCKSNISLITFYHENKKNEEIDYPWACSEKVFEDVYKDCYDSCLGLLKTIYGN